MFKKMLGLGSIVGVGIENIIEYQKRINEYEEKDKHRIPKSKFFDIEKEIELDKKVKAKAREIMYEQMRKGIHMNPDQAKIRAEILEEERLNKEALDKLNRQLDPIEYKDEFVPFEFEPPEIKFQEPPKLFDAQKNEIENLLKRNTTNDFTHYKLTPKTINEPAKVKDVVLNVIQNDPAVNIKLTEAKFAKTNNTQAINKIKEYDDFDELMNQLKTINEPAKVHHTANNNNLLQDDKYNIKLTQVPEATITKTKQDDINRELRRNKEPARIDLPSSKPLLSNLDELIIDLKQPPKETITKSSAPIIAVETASTALDKLGKTAEIATVAGTSAVAAGILGGKLIQNLTLDAQNILQEEKKALFKQNKMAAKKKNISEKVATDVARRFVNNMAHNDRGSLVKIASDFDEDDLTKILRYASKADKLPKDISNLFAGKRDEDGNPIGNSDYAKKLISTFRVDKASPMYIGKWLNVTKPKYETMNLDMFKYPEKYGNSISNEQEKKELNPGVHSATTPGRNFAPENKQYELWKKMGQKIESGNLKFATQDKAMEYLSAYDMMWEAAGSPEREERNRNRFKLEELLHKEYGYKRPPVEEEQDERIEPSMKEHFDNLSNTIKKVDLKSITKDTAKKIVDEYKRTWQISGKPNEPEFNANVKKLDDFIVERHESPSLFYQNFQERLARNKDKIPNNADARTEWEEMTREIEHGDMQHVGGRRDEIQSYLKLYEKMWDAAGRPEPEKTKAALNRFGETTHDFNPVATREGADPIYEKVAEEEKKQANLDAEPKRQEERSFRENQPGNQELTTPIVNEGPNETPVNFGQEPKVADKDFASAVAKELLLNGAEFAGAYASSQMFGPYGAYMYSTLFNNIGRSLLAQDNAFQAQAKPFAQGITNAFVNNYTKVKEMGVFGKKETKRNTNSDFIDGDSTLKRKGDPQNGERVVKARSELNEMGFEAANINELATVNDLSNVSPQISEIFLNRQPNDLVRQTQEDYQAWYRNSAPYAVRNDVRWNNNNNQFLF